MHHNTSALMAQNAVFSDNARPNVPVLPEMYVAAANSRRGDVDEAFPWAWGGDIRFRDVDFVGWVGRDGEVFGFAGEDGGGCARHFGECDILDDHNVDEVLND